MRRALRYGKTGQRPTTSCCILLPPDWIHIVIFGPPGDKTGHSMGGKHAGRPFPAARSPHELRRICGGDARSAGRQIVRCNLARRSCWAASARRWTPTSCWSPCCLRNRARTTGRRSSNVRIATARRSPSCRLLRMSADGTIEAAAVAVGGASEVALRLSALEAALAGRRCEPLADAVGAASVAELSPIDDCRATAPHRLHLAQLAVARAFNACIEENARGASTA